MENLEKNEVMAENDEKKVSIPFLVASAFFIACAALYTYYLIDLRDVLISAFQNGLIKWYFSVTVLDYLMAITLALMTLFIAFEKKHIKLLMIPAAVGAAISIYTVVSTIVDSGFSAVDAAFLIRNVGLALTYICLFIYTIKESIAIVFAVVFATYSGAFSLWYNLEGTIERLNMGGEFKSVVPHLLLVALAIGILVTVWSLCVLHSKKAKGKDIIKKNLVLSVVLSIITLDIYSVFWVKSLSEDIAKLEGKEVNSSLETALFFTVPFYFLFWLYKKGKKLAVLADDADMSVLYVVQGVFCLGLFALALMQNQMHMAVGLKE